MRSEARKEAFNQVIRTGRALSNFNTQLIRVYGTLDPAKTSLNEVDVQQRRRLNDEYTAASAAYALFRKRA